MKDVLWKAVNPPSKISILVPNLLLDYKSRTLGGESRVFELNCSIYQHKLHDRFKSKLLRVYKSKNKLATGQNHEH